MNALHVEIAGLAKDYPAGYINKDSFAYFTIDRLREVARALTGREIPAGSGRLSASLRDVILPNTASIELVAPRNLNPGLPEQEVDVRITSNFSVIFDVFVAGDATSRISEVVLQFSEFRVRMHAKDNALIFEGSDFDLVRQFTRTPDAETILVNAGIDELEASRVEGHLGYGVISQAVSMTVAARHEISLATVFPAVNFGESIKLAILQNGDSLGIIPTQPVDLRPETHCECAEGRDLPVTQTNLPPKAGLPPTVNSGDEFGAVTIGGPIAEGLNPLEAFGRRPVGATGIAGMYIPKAFTPAIVGKPMPSITFPASDKGTIGYNARATVAFKQTDFKFDLNGGGILLDMQLDINVTAYCDFEVFKGVRLPIGWAAVMPTSPGTLQLGFYPAIDGSGKLKLKSTLNKCDMGTYVAVVIGVGTALKFLGVTAWLGFLIDVILATILSLGLPIKLKEEISKYMTDKEWTLINGLPVLNPAIHGFYPAAPFDVDEKSLLTSVEFRG